MMGAQIFPALGDLLLLWQQNALSNIPSAAKIQVLCLNVVQNHGYSNRCYVKRVPLHFSYLGTYK